MWRVLFDVGSLFNASLRKELHEWVLLRFGTADMASSLCHAYQASMHDWHKAISEAWRSMVENPDLHSEGSDLWEVGPHSEMHFECFCLRMFREGVMNPAWGLPAKVESRNVSAFQGIIDHWEDPDRLAESLVVALNYHCNNFSDDGHGTPWAPFQNTPFDVVPIWYFAILKRRREEGLDTPKVSHPLLELPTANPGDYEWGTAEDPIFDELERFYKKIELPNWRQNDVRE